MNKSDLAKKLPLILVVVVVLFAIIFGFLINEFIKDKPKPKQIVQQMTTILLPPPPPPPEIEPEEIEPEIEDEIIEDEIMDESMPEEMGDSLENDLGMDADGSAGSDSFGLKARKGGRSFLGGGSVYASQIQIKINDLIAKHEELPFMYFEVVCKIWIGDKGGLDNIELVNYAGDEEAKGILKNLILAKLQVNNGPPLEMPQPIKLRLRNEF